MRLLTLLLLLPSLAAPLAAQATGRATVPEEAVTLEREAPPVTEIPVATMEGASPQIVPAPSVVNSGAAEATAQPTMRNFLYQVLLAAVTALITALIWKAVF